MESTSAITSTSSANAAYRIPFNSLPVEIISNILHITLWNEENDTEHFPRMSALASVCSFWKSVIDSTPSLWSLFDSNLPLPENRRAMQRSGTHSLTMRISAYLVVGYAIGDHSGTALSGLIKEACSHMHRWYDVHLRINYRTLEVFTLLTRAAPLPRFCSIQCERTDLMPLNLFSRSAVALERLILNSLPVDLQNLRLPNLQYLKIDGALVLTGPSHIANELAGFLKGSPNLESFILQHLPNEGNSLSGSSPPPSLDIALHLPLLRHFRVVENAAVGLLLAACLETTCELDTLEVSCYYDMQWPPVPLLHLEMLWKQFIRKFFVPMFNLEVDVSSMVFNLRGRRQPDKCHFDLRLEDQCTQCRDTIQRLKWLADILEVEGNVTPGGLNLRVPLLDIGLQAPHLLSQLQRLGQVRHLAFKYEAFAANDMNNVLPILDGRGLPGPCFPALESLNCNELHGGVGKLLAALQTRYELHPGLPKLKSLELASDMYCRPGTIESLRELLGPGVLRFTP